MGNDSFRKMFCDCTGGFGVKSAEIESFFIGVVKILFKMSKKLQSKKVKKLEMVFQQVTI